MITYNQVYKQKSHKDYGDIIREQVIGVGHSIVLTRNCATLKDNIRLRDDILDMYDLDGDNFDRLGLAL